VVLLIDFFLKLYYNRPNMSLNPSALSKLAALKKRNPTTSTVNFDTDNSSFANFFADPLAGVELPVAHETIEVADTDFNADFVFKAPEEVEEPLPIPEPEPENIEQEEDWEAAFANFSLPPVETALEPTVEITPPQTIIDDFDFDSEGFSLPDAIKLDPVTPGTFQPPTNIIAQQTAQKQVSENIPEPVTLADPLHDDFHIEQTALTPVAPENQLTVLDVSQNSKLTELLNRLSSMLKPRIQEAQERIKAMLKRTKSGDAHDLQGLLD
jgi:hypothetical protein